jgi:hypothetical protein
MKGWGGGAMTAMPRTALVMQTDLDSCRGTAAALRALGFAVNEFTDEEHLYAQALRVAAAPPGDLRSFVIVTEPTGQVLRDMELLRSAHWPTPLVLVGSGASPEIAHGLRAARLSCKKPTADELRHAIDAALEVSALN